MKIFKNNLVKIAEHNEDYKQGKVSFTLGVNQFADMVSENAISFSASCRRLTLPKSSMKFLIHTLHFL